MKCPKCGYLGFETGDQCRNCGHDFLLPAFTTDNPDNDLMINPQADEDGARLDFALGKELDLDRLIGLPESSPPLPPSVPAEEFPLFPIASDSGQSPQARPRAVTRPPLAVRRATPEVPRVRPRPIPRPARLDGYEAPPLAGLGLPVIPATDPLPRFAGAPPALRVVAAVIDLFVLGAIDAGVVYFTLRLAGLDFDAISLLPWAPLLSFFLLLNGGYFITFAGVGGQTIGQMTCGLKVIGDDGTPLAFGTATLRTLAWLLFALPFGLGLWFALGADHRALHDRLTATRVVRS
jgi:uncharacterized RDD family membrane protein YckC